ncbi:MAG TPA: IS630 family transposase, partial [Ktedonobacterales bacterium]|nr:IS630 family transposase [Ktedonobacterales bacterium]
GQVAAAFPQASVAIWANDFTDDHRIGLKPLRKQVWCLPGQRPVAPGPHRDAWCSLVAFVHSASARTVLHLASAVNIPLFAAELQAFARAVGAGPQQQMVLVLDRASRHTSTQLRVPDHPHLLFLPAYSPELNPAEQLWPLTNTALANQHFKTLDDLEEAQAARCVALPARPDRIRSTTCFHWWPRRLRKLQHPPPS